MSSACSKGFAFLTARVQLKLEAEHPRLIAHLLESIVPELPGAGAVDDDRAHAMAIRSIRTWRAATPVPRGSAVTRSRRAGQDTLCEFRTAQAVTLWPMRDRLGVQYFTQAPDLPLTRLPAARSVKGGLRIRLRCGGGLQLRRSSASTAWPSTSARPTTWRSGCTSWCSAARLGTWVAASPRTSRPADALGGSQHGAPAGLR